MILLALDLATTTGWAIGPTGSREPPRSGSIHLTKGRVGDASINLLRYLRGNTALQRPDIIVREAPLNPKYCKSSRSASISIQLHACVRQFCFERRIECPDPIFPATVRRWFCGRAHAGDSAATKRMVAAQCRILGSMPAKCTDYDRADALALWYYAEWKFASSLALLQKSEVRNVGTTVEGNA